jgi:hypothetical protein
MSPPLLDCCLLAKRNDDVLRPNSTQSVPLFSCPCSCIAIPPRNLFTDIHLAHVTQPHPVRYTTHYYPGIMYHLGDARAHQSHQNILSRLPKHYASQESATDWYQLLWH